jgi:protein-tyrosine phosphatase
VVPDDELRRRVIPLAGGVNFRDLGGYQSTDGRRVRWQTIFRSGTTHLLCEEDRARLADVNIRTIVDLRSNRERQRYPHGLLGSPGVLYWAHDHERAAGNLHRMLKDRHVRAPQLREAMINLYQTLPYEFIHLFKELLSRLSFGPLPLAFNCAAGKDRTGVAAALVLSALGVPWEEVLRDYMLTERCVPDIIRIFESPAADVIVAPEDPEVIPTVFGVDPLYLEAMRDSLMKRSGSIARYLGSDVGLDPSALDHLRQRLLI